MSIRRDAEDDKTVARHHIDSHHTALHPGLRPEAAEAARRIGNTIDSGFRSKDEYYKARRQMLDMDRAVGFDHKCRSRASRLEEEVDKIIQSLKNQDCTEVYGKAPARTGFGGQLHKRIPGDHFLSNVDLIGQTEIFNIARRMPKGSHLHIHFNACLQPQVLLNIAKDMERMCISSDLPLVSGNHYENFDRCEIQFSIKAVGCATQGNLFSSNYEARQWMKFSEFLRLFPSKYRKTKNANAMKWLASKLVFQDEEAHNCLQTAEGAWEKFNGRTRMMKGLFNYETAYRRYTRLFLEDLMHDNIQYAEIRPNFMSTNQLCRDDGTGSIDNRGIMNIIIGEVEKFKAEMAKGNRLFQGLKVIYCTPRSFSPEKVKEALDECIQFKQEWPQWIAGFDLIGEECKGRPLKDFIPELLEFQDNCRNLNLDIPFLFHCGETLEIGTDTDANLVDALLLNSKRIGHGYALAKHPYIMQQMKARGVCLELCPISNEILGLTPRASGHSMYDLLANNVHCTVSSDNGTIFRSTLSHDFYQVMIGKNDMGLAGWKQLILWSIEHSCMNDAERETALEQWNQEWEEFLKWVVLTYRSYRDERL
ncbi:unnamed protein product [Clonostachys chloroleuca]|uniref:adenosine deaminase n=1 Tax=Clonostachys chloroleuca TaxID=1926264 RepID=A0AA35Q189_9HYPO|nr:unnamed protein product [Clonostachys chloroleuca]